VTSRPSKIRTTVLLPYRQPHLPRGGQRGAEDYEPTLVRPLDDLIEAVTHRLPALESARIRRGWAGLREMTPDELAIVGPVLGIEGFLVAAGFSGHGFMHAPAIGKVMAELILDGKASTIDISALSLDRFRTGQLVPERAVF